MTTTIPTQIKRLTRRAVGNARYSGLVKSYFNNSARFHPRYRASLRRLSTYKNIHLGERCFIIGNGPSIKITDLSLLRDEYTFGMNRIYLLFDELNFLPSYYVSVNRLVLEQCAQEIAQLTMPKFIKWDTHRFIGEAKDLLFLLLLEKPGFHPDITKGIWEGATVTYVAMQIAYFMGFSRVVLIGVDHSFQTKGKPNETVVSEGYDPNHFSPDYFGSGFRWQLPDLEVSEKAYQMAKNRFESSDREILDATIGGKLQIFPKIDYGQLFSS